MPVNAIYVEDEPTIAQLLKSALGAFDIAVKTYPRSEALLADYADPDVEKAAVFIFDIRMPGMSGLELAARLRAEGEQRPILIVSAFN